MKTHPLKVEREMRGWSQARVAKELGTTTRTVSRWELGLATPYPYYREQLCILFGKTAQELGLPADTDEKHNGHKPLPTDADALATTTQASFLVDPTIPEALGSTDSLLGRDDLLELVKKYLMVDNHQAPIALSGLPGIGKTTLAVALTRDRQVQAHFCDGILWAGLGPRPNVLACWLVGVLS